MHLLNYQTVIIFFNSFFTFTNWYDNLLCKLWIDKFDVNVYRDDLESYSIVIEKLAIQIIELMANAIGVDTKEIRELFGEATQSTRLNYYPPCPQPELVTGLNSHSDGGGLTILLQGNEVEGLQIIKDGLWIPIKPLSNAFIVNIGDMLEVIIN